MRVRSSGNPADGARGQAPSLAAGSVAPVQSQGLLSLVLGLMPPAQKPSRPMSRLFPLLPSKDMAVAIEFGMGRVFGILGVEMGRQAELGLATGDWWGPRKEEKKKQDSGHGVLGWRGCMCGF